MSNRQSADTKAGNAKSVSLNARSLNSQLHDLLLECPSWQVLFQKTLKLCQEQFRSTVGRLDYSIGTSPQVELTHDPRMAKGLAERFSSEYMEPFAKEIRSASATEPKLKRYERGDQKMTLIGAPIIDPASNKCDGAVVLMLGGGTHKPELVLPKLDAVTAMISTVLMAKSGSFSKSNSQGGAQPPESAPVSPTQQMLENSALSRTSQFTSTREFGFSIVNSLCGQLQAEQVFFGVENRQRMIVEAVSGFPDFKASSPGIAVVRQAMEECLDTNTAVVSQAEMPVGTEQLPIHQQWSAENKNSCVCSIPLKQGMETTGVISIRRPSTRPFTAEEIEKLEKSLAPYGSAIRVVEKANRSMGVQVKSAVADTARRNLGKGAVGRKVVCAAVALGLLWFLFGSMTYRPICQTRVTAQDLRHYSAPLDGQLKAVHVVPGQSVAKGELLVEFDTSNLRLELNALTRQLTSAEVELRQAINDNDMAMAALSRSQANVLQAQIEAIERQILDSQIRAPNDGTVVLSDLQQRVGQVFAQGDEILQFAPEGDWLLEIEIPDDIINCVEVEQSGTFAAAALPTEKQSFQINHIDGSAVVVNDRNVFIARAPLVERPDWLKTGMEGTVQLETVTRPVWWVAMHRVVDWARVNFWI